MDWVIGSEFSSLLEGDPRINNRVQFKRSAGFFAWHQLCDQLFSQGYDEVLDLHGSLRTLYARFYFNIRGLLQGSTVPPWRALSKKRWQRVGFFVFKRFWPKKLRPGFLGGLSVQAARLSGGHECDRPDLLFLLKSPVSDRVQASLNQFSSSQGFLTVMPGAAWPGKRWSQEELVSFLKKVNLPVAVLGTERDLQSRDLFASLKVNGVVAVAAFQNFSFVETAQLIHFSRCLISNDTGLVHLAESIGQRVLAVFGPTDPDLGFGPWRESSRSVSSTLWCRPCSKDGSACFRIGKSRFLCMKELSSKKVFETFQKMSETEAFR